MNPVDFRFFFLLCWSFWIVGGLSRGAPLTWDANGTASGQTDGLGTWLNANQWHNGAANVTWTNPSDALIGNSGVGDVITLGVVTAGALEFGPFTGTYTLTGGSLGLAAGLKLNATSGQVLINSPIVVGANQTWTNNSVNPLTSAGIVSGGFGITKEGPGVIVMSGANIFTGNVNLNAGILRTNASNVGTLGSGASALFMNGGTLDIQSSSSTVFGRNMTVTVNTTLIPNRSIVGSGLTYSFGTLTLGNQTLEVPGGGNINSGTASLTFTGATTLTGTPTFNVVNPLLGGGTQLTIGAVGAAAQGIVKNGNGLLILSGANAYTGNTTINGGTLRFSNATFAAPARSIKMANGTTLASGTAINNAFLNRIEESSNSIVIALAAISNTSALDFSSSTGATLPNASLGALPATVSPTYSGTLTPFGNIYRLGGGGGVLVMQGTMSGLGNFLVINGPGTVSLSPSGSNTYDDGTYVNPGAALQFARTGSNQDLGGSGRSVVVSEGGSVLCSTSTGIDNSFLGRLVETPNTLSIYMLQNSANALDFNTSSGATLPNAILGGLGIYSGVITPNNSVYRLGGGVYAASAGDEMTLPGAALVGSNAVVISSKFNTSSTNAHRVVLSGTNTYTETTTVDRQALRLDSSTGSITNSRGIELINGGQLLLNNSGVSSNNTNRLGNTAGLTITNGGSVTFTSASDTADYFEMVGPLTARSGMFQYNATNTFAAGKLNQMTFGGVSTPGTGTVAFNASSALGAATTGNPTVLIAGQPDLGGATGDWLGPQFVATRSTSSFAGYGATGVIALTGTPTASSLLQTLTATSTDAAKIYRLTGNTSLTLSAGPTTRTWKGFTYQGLSSTQGIDLNGNTVKLVGGGLAVSNATLAITNGTITSGNAQSVPLYIHVQSTSGSTTTISAAITDNPGGGALTLIKSNNASAAGTLILSGANTYTGDTIVNAGTLVLTTPHLANGADVRLYAASTLQLDYVGTDTVRRLYIDGIQQAAGTWGAPDSGATNTSLLIAGKGLLNVTQSPPSAASPGFASWIASFNLTGADAAPANDFDRDGLPNAVEYVLASSPLTFSPGRPAAASVGGNFSFSFQRAVGHKTADVTTSIELGTGLNIWPSIYQVGNDTATSTPSVTITPGPSPAVEIVTLTVPLGQEVRRFARLRVTITQ